MAEQFSVEQLDQLEGRMRKVFNEGVEQLVNPQFDKVYDLLDKMGAVQADHTDELGQIKGMLGSQQKLSDYHDREIERLLKHENLDPLALEE